MSAISSSVSSRTLTSDPTAWYNKTPQIAGDQIPINRQLYEVKNLAYGDFHGIYQIINSGSPGQILKIIKPGYHPAGKLTRAQILIEDIKELEDAKKYGIPMPICFLRPDNYDPENKEKGFKGAFNGGFFVMEYVPNPVTFTWKSKPKSEWSEQEIKIFDLVRLVLKLATVHKKEIAPDFFSRNVMIRDDGTPLVVDFFQPEPNEDLVDAIEEKIAHWSDGNKEVESYIEEGLIPDWRNKVTEKTLPSEMEVSKETPSLESENQDNSTLESEREEAPAKRQRRS